MTRFKPRFLSTLIALTLFPVATLASAENIRVAVAANFTAAAKEVATAFEKKSGHTVSLSFGSTGKLYTQIANGAPFDVFMAADQKRPEKAENMGLAVSGSRFTYARGRLALYCPDGAEGGAVLQDPERLSRIAIANPVTAPYGAAAVAYMKKQGNYDSLSAYLVQGDSIAQTFQFVKTGNAGAGFVALSQVVGEPDASVWLLPEDSYPAIRQDAVLLQRGERKEAAAAWLKFLRSEDARRIIKRYGYGS